MPTMTATDSGKQMTRSMRAVPNGEVGSPERVVTDVYRASLYGTLAYLDRAVPVSLDVTYSDGRHKLDTFPMLVIKNLPAITHDDGELETELTDLEKRIMEVFYQIEQPTKVVALASKLKHAHSSYFRAAVKHLVGLGLVIRTEDGQYWRADAPLPVPA